FVYGPHQAGVAFLNEVEERQAAVAILLGDRNDQPQVAAGELALGQLVLNEVLADCLTSLAKAFRTFECQEHQVEQLPTQLGLLFTARIVAANDRQTSPDLVHPFGKLFELLHQRQDAAGPQAQLLDELQALAAAAEERLASGKSHGHWRRFAD